jgi:hypothetical protein
MPEPLQSNLHLLTLEQRQTMAAILRTIASNRKLTKAERDAAAARSDELDPPNGVATQDQKADESSATRPGVTFQPFIPPSPLFKVDP